MTDLGPNMFVPCLDKGYVRYLDHMGCDMDIVGAARVSYQGHSKGEEADKKLLFYLWKNKHTSPFEMGKVRFEIKMPIFVMRQYIRHRMQCLAGSTKLHFDAPRGQKRGVANLNKLTIKQIFDRWQPTKGEQGNPLYKRERVQKMGLRCLNEDTREINHTRITNCWKSGLKEVFDVELEGGLMVRMSKNHRIYTDKGWKCLYECSKEDKIASIVPEWKSAPRLFPSYTEKELIKEEWRDIVGFSNYQVSSLGRVSSFVSQGRRKKGEIRNLKKLTYISTGHSVVGISNGKTCTVPHVHKLVLETFAGPRPDRLEARHLNGNGFDNRLSNLEWSTKTQNQKDRSTHGAVPSLGCVFQKIKDIRRIGMEMTYDIEVEGPWHNFSANGMVVHNSLNEISARYSQLPADFYIPSQWRKQDSKNKQGSKAEEGWNPTSSFSELGTIGISASEAVEKHARESYQLYEILLASGIAKEMARIVLPLNIYTMFHCVWDLRNLLHFITLRDDSHAQAEIQEYGKAMKVILQELFPWTMEAYERFKWKCIEEA